MKKIVVLVIVFELLLSLIIIVRPAFSGATSVFVDPSLTEYYNNAVGQQFTVSIKIADVMNLYGFDMVLEWNTTFLAYVSHSIRVPKDTYSDGVLWNPVWQIEDQVNASTGTYWIAFACMWPAPTFNGSGTVFTITFQVIYQPVQPQPDANITLHLYSSTSSSPDLSNNVGQPIPHTTQDGTVLLHALPGTGHDIAVTNVTSYKKIIFQGFTANFTVTVENHGGFSETFDVSLNASNAVVVTQTMDNMLNGTSANITFTWNTTGFAKANYTISAYANPVPGETDTADNNFTGGWIMVSMVGDLTGGTSNVWDFVPDGKCDGKDISVAARCFGSIPGCSPPLMWNANCDVNNDGKVDGKDISIVARHFGEVDP